MRAPVAGVRPAGRMLVVGLGSPDRGDDAVGPIVASAVARALSAQGRAGVHVVEHEDPTALIDLMGSGGRDGERTGGWDAVVIIDAVRSGAPAGTVTVLQAGSGAPGLAAAGARLDPGPAGTHGFGLAGALELTRALDRLPSRVAVVGIEAVGFEHGQPLSAPVAESVGSAVQTVMTLLLVTASPA
jgi:hydrogenase maturation protease